MYKLAGLYDIHVLLMRRSHKQNTWTKRGLSLTKTKFLSILNFKRTCRLYGLETDNRINGAWSISSFSWLYYRTRGPTIEILWKYCIIYAFELPFWPYAVNISMACTKAVLVRCFHSMDMYGLILPNECTCRANWLETKEKQKRSPVTVSKGVGVYIAIAWCIVSPGADHGQ